MAQSIGPIPTFYLTSEIDMERVAEAREALGSKPKISFNDIVLKGTRADGGMASFADVLTPAQAEAIHAYLIARGNEDYADAAARAQ